MHHCSPHHIEGLQVSASASHFSAEIGGLGGIHKGAPRDLHGSPPGVCDQYGREGQSYDSWGVTVLRAKQVKRLKVCCGGVGVGVVGVSTSGGAPAEVYACMHTLALDRMQLILNLTGPVLHQKQTLVLSFNCLWTGSGL